MGNFLYIGLSDLKELDRKFFEISVTFFKIFYYAEFREKTRFCRNLKSKQPNSREMESKN